MVSAQPKSRRASVPRSRRRGGADQLRRPQSSVVRRSGWPPSAESAVRGHGRPCIVAHRSGLQYESDGMAEAPEGCVSIFLATHQLRRHASSRKETLANNLTHMKSFWSPNRIPRKMTSRGVRRRGSPDAPALWLSTAKPELSSRACRIIWGCLT